MSQRNSKPPASKGEKTTGSRKKIFGIALAGTLIFIATMFAVNLAVLPGGEEEETPILTFDDFDITYIDDIRNFTIADRDLDIYLYTCTDVDDASTYTLLLSSTSSADIAASDFEDELDADELLVANISGAISFAEYDGPDQLDPTMDFDRTYDDFWVVLNPYALNTVRITQEPSDGGFVALNSETLAYINLATANITTATNFTIIAATNATEEDARYITQTGIYEDYELSFLVRTNATVLTSYLTISGTSKTLVNSTCLRFDVTATEALGPSPMAFFATWDDATPVTIEIDTIEMQYRGVAV
jgi:hypothetical protein